MPIGDYLGAGTAVLGMVGNAIGQNNQNAQTEHLMGIQHQNQMALNQQMQQIQQQNWDYTNAENQVKHYKNAGLNVGLMYGGSGAGGATMGGGSGGSAAMGSAAQSPNYMELGAQMLQAQQIQAQTDLAKAQAEKLRAEKQKLEGADTELTIAQANNFKSTTDLNNWQLKFNQASENDRLSMLNTQAKELEALYPGNVEKQGLELANLWWDTQVKQTGIKNTEALTDKARNDIYVSLKHLHNETRGLDQKASEIKLEKWKANLQRQMPGVGQVIGRIGNGAINAILGTLTGHMNEYTDYKN